MSGSSSGWSRPFAIGGHTCGAVTFFFVLTITVSSIYWTNAC
jgi:hypothetical protein